MDKKTAWILGIIALIIIVILVRRGNAPATTDTAPTNAKTPLEDNAVKEDENVIKEDEEKATAKEDGGATAEKDGALALSATAMGNSGVKLTWSAPAGLNESNRFIIVRDELENPEHTGKNFWIRQSHLKREVTWEMVPTGTLHFRLCLTENDLKDACAKYSNDVIVEVK